jgi:predicted HicB family RNase H-like nuclease
MSEDTRTTLRLPSELKEKLMEEAKKQNRSVHNLIITILQNYFSK